VKAKKVYQWGLVLTISFILTFLFSGCADRITEINPSPTDVVTIGDINKHITQSDLGAGIQKTNGVIASVKMSHKAHEQAGVQCIVCHHKKGNDDRIKECAQCHKGSQGEKLMHDFCIACHVEKAKGPSMCQDCHLTGATGRK